jgi:hypothetical protein
MMVARTIAACGEPMRDYIFPDLLKTRLLTYREATLWFMDGDNGWFFRGWGKSATDVPVLNRDEVGKLLPCFAKVAPPTLPVSSPGLAAKPADGEGVQQISPASTRLCYVAWGHFCTSFLGW